MLGKITSITKKARNMVKIGLVIMAFIKAINLLCDELEKLEPKKEESDE